MGEREILTLIEAIKATWDREKPAESLRSFVLPWLTWELQLLEDSLGIALPPDLVDLWNQACGVVMFWDTAHGQWGLVLWSPDQTHTRHQRRYRVRAMEERRNGDLTIGEFLGDSDPVVIRCDPTSSDFGALLISKAIDRRESWRAAATSLTEFLQRFWQARGEKYWEPA